MTDSPNAGVPRLFAPLGSGKVNQPDPETLIRVILEGAEAAEPNRCLAPVHSRAALNVSRLTSQSPPMSARAGAIRPSPWRQGEFSALCRVSKPDLNEFADPKGRNATASNRESPS